MRRAGQIGAGAHVRAMRIVRPGLTENEIEAEFLHEFRRQGAQVPSYTPIVAGGPTPACCTTCATTRRSTRATCFSSMPAASSTATRPTSRGRYPVNGRFSGPNARSLRACSGCAAGGDRGSQARQSLGPAARRCGEGSGAGSSIWGSCRAPSTRCLERATTSASTCTAPGTGSVSTCTMPATTSAERQLTAPRARHGAHGRARLLCPAGRRRARAILEHWHSHRGRRARHRRRLRGPHRRRPKHVAEIEALMRDARRA